MYEKMLAGIRTVDQDNIFWLEPQILFDFGTDSHLGERGIADGQLGFSWHDYCLPETLLQAFGLKKLPACQPLEQRVFSNARVTSRRLGSGSLMTEFGASDDLPDTARLVGYADDNMTGWMVWHYKNWGDPTTQAQGSGAQSLFRSDRDFGSVKQAKLEILERPYPSAPRPARWRPSCTCRRCTTRTATPCRCWAATWCRSRMRRSCASWPTPA